MTTKRFTAKAGLDNNGQTITNVAEPVDSTDAANKAYVDSAVIPTGLSTGIYEGAATISNDYTITVGNNALSAGPITVADGVSVTVPDGSVWSIV